MFAHCIFCKTELGSNPVIEAFPVGRRLAFDEANGRLWVVCMRCARWNLSPLEERWEAIESCERLFRRAHRRVSTDHIGFSVLPEGLELVRIGRPQRPELAAWRYGSQLLRRRRRHQLTQSLSTGLVVASGAAVPLWPITIPLIIHHLYQDRKVLVRADAPEGERVGLTRRDARRMKLIAADNEWMLRVPRSTGKPIIVHGADALRVAGALLPSVNPAGGNSDGVEYAVRQIERLGTGGEFFDAAARLMAQPRGALAGPDARVIKAPPGLRLALEMAAHEEAELEAMRGELQALEAAWREAEEIAAIADDLLVPRVVRDIMSRLRAAASG